MRRDQAIKRVEGYHGWIEVDGVRYSRDIIIHTDWKVTERETHLSLHYRDGCFHTPLSEDELRFLLEEKPEVVIIGAGYKGMMSLTPRAKEMLGGIEHEILMTQQAVDRVNEEDRRFVAILHITC